VRYPGPPRLKEQAVSLASPLRVVLAGLQQVLVDGHGPLLATAQCEGDLPLIGLRPPLWTVSGPGS
jgi:hypothetical protein